jgi:hypothetical protein
MKHLIGVLPFRIISFWLLIGIAAVGFVIAVYKFGRHIS